MDVARDAVLDLKKALEALGETENVTIQVHRHPRLSIFRTDAVRVGRMPPSSVQAQIHKVEHMCIELSLKRPFSAEAGAYDFVMDCSFGPKYDVCEAIWILRALPAHVNEVCHRVNLLSGERTWELATDYAECVISAGVKDTDELVLHNKLNPAKRASEETMKQFWEKFCLIVPPEVSEIITHPPTDETVLRYGCAHRHPLIQEALRKLRAVDETVRAAKPKTKMVNIILRGGTGNYIEADSCVLNDTKLLGSLCGLRKPLSALKIVEGVDTGTLVIQYESFPEEQKAFFS